MLGAFAGDVIGSAWEGSGAKRYDFPLFSEFSRFTDDSVMTAAVAHALMEPCGYAEAMRSWGRRYPFAGYGQKFEQWLLDPAMGPYQSLGNGGAMRAGPIGYAVRSVEEAIEEGARSAALTHDHPEGIKGAQAVALAVFLARSGASKADIRSAIEARVGYDLTRTVHDVRPGYQYTVEANGSVPEAIICFLDAEDFEAAVRNAVALGGDTDTMACIAGAIAEAHWGGVPDAIAREVSARLPQEFIELQVRFDRQYSRT